MILIFDLDDTLYMERSFVESGLREVAWWLSGLFGWDPYDSMNEMFKTIEQEGRGKVFNRLLMTKNKLSATLVKKCVSVYRHHSPRISISYEIEKLLSDFIEPLYLVTDGHKVVQQNKISALRIEHYFKKVFITHRYGIRNAKPSIYCFDIIRRMEKCEWKEMVYVGDNPAKDFVNLTPLGVRTIRVKTGEHMNVIANPGFEATDIISDLSELPKLLKDFI